MKKLLFIVLLFILLLSFSAKSQLFYESFNSTYSSHFYSSAGTSNAGNTYTCTSANGVGLVTSDAYFTTNTVYVSSGKSVKISFYLNKASGYTASNTSVYFIANKATTFNTMNPTWNGWTKVSSYSPVYSCGLNTITLPASVVGGQRLSITIYFKYAGTSSWVAIEDLKIEEDTYTAPPTSYLENFNAGKWYPDGNIGIPYHAFYTSSNGYTYLSNYGKDGYGDYFASFYSGYDYVEGGGSNFITKEINTSGFQNGELRFMWRSQYPCGGPNGATGDETYSSYAPKVWILAGDFASNSWQQLPVNYYFPDATWRYASYDISQYKNQSVKIKFERGLVYCTDLAEGVDNIKVYDRNCLISNEVCGPITGTDNPSPGSNVQYSVEAVTGAVYYKWLVRNGGILYSKPPFIVSGQGTQNVTVNFGSIASPKLICIPYDADLSKPATDTTGVCYAKLAFKGLTISQCVQPGINSQTSTLTKCTGETADFTVTASGTAPFTYLWEKDGNPLSEGTNSNYSITSVATIDAGSYSCIVSNSCGSITSDFAILSVTQSAEITSQPSNQAKCSGQSAQFSVTANGNDPITYQWILNGTNIPGATLNNYTISSVTSENAGNYSCIVTNSCGSISSSTVILSINSIVNITAQPAGLTKCTGEDALFTINAGGGDLLYQWKKNGTDITGATGSLFSISSVATANAGTFSCLVSNSCGSKTSDDAILSVNTPPQITKQPVSQTKNTGQEVIFSVETTGTEPFSYQWKLNGADIPGATLNPYTKNPLVTEDAGDYSCIVSNPCGSLTSSTATLTVNIIITINTQPEALTKCTGDAATFVIDATGGAISYQWKKDGVNLTGGTDSNYFIPSVILADDGDYFCVLSNVYENITSNPASLTVYQKPALNNTFVNITKYIGDTLIYSLSPSGGVSFTYQWKKNNVDITGATINKLVINSLDLDDQGKYSCYVTDDCGFTSGDIFRLIVVDNFLSKASGVVTYDNTDMTPLSNIKLYLKNSEKIIIDSAITNTKGEYAFYNLLPGYYLVDASTSKKWGGSNPVDALLVNRSYIGIYKFPDAIRKLAADVSNDKKVTPTDALMINRRYIGILSNFKSGDWVFMSDTINIAGSDITMNITGLCTGDVNASYINIPVKKETTLTYRDYVNVQPGEIFELPVKINENIELGAMGIKLKIENEEIKIIGVKSELKELIYNITDNGVNIAWTADAEEYNITPDKPLFVLRCIFYPSPNSPFSILHSPFSLESESIISDIDANLISTDKLVMPKLQFSIQNHACRQAGSEFRIQTRPNPMHQSSVISYQLPEDTHVSIKIYDMFGKEIAVLADEYMLKGKHETNFNAGNLLAGIYVYSLRAGDKKAIGKIVLIK